jgi:methionyl-tRNA formyltransferase
MLADLEALRPDLIVSIRFSHIFSTPFLRLPRLGLLNVHPGELPHYAGLFAPFWQMLHGRDRIGCTVHWIDHGIDTGPLIWQGGLPVDPGRSLLWHICQTYPLGVDEVLSVIRDLHAGRRPAGVVQDGRARHYYRLPSGSDFDRFRKMGLRIVDYDEYQDLLAPFGRLGSGHAHADLARAGFPVRQPA